MKTGLRVPLSLLLVALMVALFSLRAAAQEETLPWEGHENLSRSGAASAPLLLRRPDSLWQLFWQDRFDGLTTAIQQPQGWSESRPIPLPRRAENPTEEVEALSLHFDSAATLHALWASKAQPTAERNSLFYSRRALDAAAWQESVLLGEFALAWEFIETPALLHLFYVRPVDSEQFSAGIYYRRSTDGGATWSAGQQLAASRYLRLSAVGEITLRAAASPDGALHLVWDDPFAGAAFALRSPDAGQTWGAAAALPDAGARHPMVAATPTTLLRLWALPDAAGGCAVRAQRSSDGGQRWSAVQSLATDLRGCQSGWGSQPLGGERLLLWQGVGSERLTFLLWDGARWSEPRPLALRVPQAGSAQPLLLSALQPAVVGERLAVAGLSSDGELWFQESGLDMAAWAFAPPSLWQPPTNVSQGVAWSGVPVLAADGDGAGHLVWSQDAAGRGPGEQLFYARWDGEGWTSPMAVTSRRPTEGERRAYAEQPRLVAADSLLHLLWSGGEAGQLFYSRADAQAAFASGAWSSPMLLSGSAPLACCPTLAADRGGGLHLVYSVPINEGRGLYYRHSRDGGEQWSAPTLLFDAAAAGWNSLGQPELVVAPDGTLHLLWLRLGGGGTEALPLGIFYARSGDGGQQWSEPTRLAEAGFAWPLLALDGDGQLHALWNEPGARREWWHRRLEAGQAAWSFPQAVPEFVGVPGPAALLSDGGGGLYLAALSEEEPSQPRLRLAHWADGRWENSSPYLLDGAGAPGVAMALQGAEGRLLVALRAQSVADNAARLDIVALSQQVAPVLPSSQAGTVARTPTPLPTVAAPEPTLTPTPLPLPLDPPASGGGMLPLVLSAVGALLVVGVVVALRRFAP